MKATIIGAVTITALAACQGERMNRNEQSAASAETSSPTEMNTEMNAPATPGAETAKPAEASSRTNEPATAAPSASVVQLGSLGSCRPGAQVTAALDRLAAFADPNGDETVTRAEATSAANFLVGGFFFRADANGDGKVTPEEGREARAELMARQPALASLMQQARASGTDKPLATIAELLDIEYGKPVTIEEARGAARSAVDGLVKAADLNGDGQVTMAEARDASWKGVQSLGQNVFRSMDGDGDGKLTEEEFRKGIETPADVAFQIADHNNDGSLTQSEASAAMAQVAGQLGVPRRDKAGSE